MVNGEGDLIPQRKLLRVEAQKAQRRDVHGKDRRVFRARIRDEPLCKRSEFRRKLPVFEHPRIFSERAQPEAQPRRAAERVAVRAAMGQDDIVVMRAQRLRHFKPRHRLLLLLFPSARPLISIRGQTCARRT